MDGSVADDAGVAELYRGSYARLVSVVALAAGSQAEAEECVQEALIRLLGRWSHVQHYDDPEAWVRNVAFRLLSNRRRKALGGVKALLRSGPAASVPEPDPTHLDIARALQTLPLGQRQVVVLHHLAGLPVADVGRALGIAPGTVKSRLSRARTALEPLLREESSRA